MKNKKLISVILTVFILIAIMMPSFTVLAAGCDCGNTPVIYVRGRSPIVNKAGHSSWSSPEIYELPSVPDGYIGEKAKVLAPAFAKAYLTNNYKEYNKILVDAFDEIYAEYRLDENGNVTNESGSEANQQLTNLPDKHNRVLDITDGAGAYEYCYQYFFQYDIRLDPCATAVDLHTFVESVKKATGHDTVKFIARCMGSNILTAYFAEYGWADVEDVILYNPIVNGTTVTNAAFTGNLKVDSQSLDYFANQAIDMEDAELLSLITDTINLANANYSLGLTAAMLNPVIKRIVSEVTPELLKLSYGTTPGYWSMVSNENYEKAKAFVFGAEGDAEKYAGLIEKLDNYQEKVGAHIYDIYEQMGKDGVNVYNISKYGLQCYPVAEEANEQSDIIVSLKAQTFGVTAAEMGTKLSAKYIKEAEETGTAKYISPDKVVDASTCMYPDTTWIIKDMEHNCYPWCVDKLMAKILTYDGEGIMTVDTDPDYPQYLIYDNNKDEHLSTITPMTDEKTGSVTEKVNFFKAVINFFKSIFNYLKKLLSK